MVGTGGCNADHLGAAVVSIVRVSKRERFVVMDKTGLEDPRLSFKTKGLLAYLLAKPDNWTINYRQLVKVGPDGKSLVLSALKELEKYGYLQRRRVNTSEGYRWEQTLYEYPMGGKPEHGKPPWADAWRMDPLTEEGSTETRHAPKTKPPTQAPYVMCDQCDCAVLVRDLEAHNAGHEVAS